MKGLYRRRTGFKQHVIVYGEKIVILNTFSNLNWGQTTTQNVYMSRRGHTPPEIIFVHYERIA